MFSMLFMLKICLTKALVGPSFLLFRRNLGLLMLRTSFPISLVNGVYRIVAKVLANMLKM
jgi:hypothetical protein